MRRKTTETPYTQSQRIIILLSMLILRSPTGITTTETNLTQLVNTDTKNLDKGQTRTGIRTTTNATNPAAVTNQGNDIVKRTERFLGNVTITSGIGRFISAINFLNTFICDFIFLFSLKPHANYLDLKQLALPNPPFFDIFFLFTIFVFFLVAVASIAIA